MAVVSSNLWVRAKAHAIMLTAIGCVTLLACDTSLVLAAPNEAPAAEADSRPAGGILDLDIDQLAATPVVIPQMDIPVSSVEKHESTVGKSSAAIYVITSEMIRRSAANNIPDLLRLVPGVEVCRANADSWAISVRGANDRFTNKLLVLIDGRTVYSPIFAGVYWDIQDLVFDDIERIEVIRGPGGTLWGDNAVNGVINIITKKAKDTQGSLLTYGAGTEDRSIAQARYGGKIGDDWHYRISGKHREEAPGWGDYEGTPGDGYRQGRVGFRADWQPKDDDNNLMTIQGDVYRGVSNCFGRYAIPNPPVPSSLPRTVLFGEGEDVSGGNILGRFTHTFDEESDWMLQMYFDRTDRYMSIWDQQVGIFDIEFQNRFPMGDRHDVTWGAQYRQTHDNEYCQGFVVGFDPASKTTELYNMFIQDQITLVEDRWFFTIGTKLEYNDYTGHEYQPSGRILFTPTNKQTFWAAISRAVVLPSRMDFDGYFTRNRYERPYYERQVGNSGLTSEKLWAYEIGYRAQPTKKFSYDVALFYYDFKKLRTSSDPWQDTEHTFGSLVYAVSITDTCEGVARGGELGMTYALTDTWRLSGWGSWMNQTNFDRNPNSQARLMSSWDLGERWQFDMILRYVDSIVQLEVPKYFEMDLRLACQLREHLEVSLIGRNLLDSHHPEFDQGRYPYYVTEVERSVFGGLTWRY